MEKIDSIKLHEAFQKLRIEKQIEPLYDCSHNLVKAIAFSIVKKEEIAEEISQEVFLKLLQLPSDNLPSKKEASWLYTVVKNECFAYYRKQRQTISMEEIYEIENPNSEIEQMIDKQKFNHIISGLKEIDKQVVCLKIIAGYTFKEIGLLLGMPTGTAQWRYYQAICSLKTLLSSLSGFIITFTLGILSSNNFKKEAPEINSNQIQNEEIEQDKENSTSKENQINNNIMQNNVGNETIQPDTVYSANVQGVSIALFTFSSIFFIITITFLIILKNHQQNRKQKASK